MNGSGTIGKTRHTMSGVQHTTRVFLISHVTGGAGAIARLSHLGLLCVSYNDSDDWVKKGDLIRCLKIDIYPCLSSFLLRLL